MDDKRSLIERAFSNQMLVAAIAVLGAGIGFFGLQFDRHANNDDVTRLQTTILLLRTEVAELSKENAEKHTTPLPAPTCPAPEQWNKLTDDINELLKRVPPRHLHGAKD